VDPNEYTDLSNIKEMMAQSVKRQGLGYSEVATESKRGQVKHLTKQQVLGKRDTKEHEVVAARSVVDHQSEKTKVIRKKI
jgi:hypothetical protein